MCTLLLRGIKQRMLYCFTGTYGKIDIAAKVKDTGVKQ